MLAEVATCVPEFTPFGVKCYGERSTTEFPAMGAGERMKTACSSGVHQEAPMGSTVFCLPLRSGLIRFGMAFDSEGLEIFAYMDITLGLWGVKASTALHLVPFIRNELARIVIVAIPNKTVALPPMGHIQAPGDIFPPEDCRHLHNRKRGRDGSGRPDRLRRGRD